MGGGSIPNKVRAHEKQENTYERWKDWGCEPLSFGVALLDNAFTGRLALFRGGIFNEECNIGVSLGVLFFVRMMLLFNGQMYIY